MTAPRVLRLLLVVALALGALQWWALSRAELAVQRFLYQWQAYGTVHYQHLWVNLWGSGSLSEVTLEPAGLAQAMLGTPLGYRLQLRRLRLDQLDVGTDGSVTHARVRLDDLVLPMDDGYRLRGRNAPPALLDLGYGQLRLQASLDLRVPPDSGSLQIGAALRGDDSADLDLDLQLQTTPRQLSQAPDQVGLQQLKLRYRDRGLMPRYLQRRAEELGTRPEAVAGALIQLLDTRAAREKWRWEPASATALRDFLRAPRAFEATLDPPGEVTLKNLNLYPVGDWSPVLGFRFRVPPPGPAAAGEP